MNRLVELAGQYGIYALVEFHQNLFSEKFCADGVPVWAIPKSISRGFPLPISKPGTFDNVTGMPTGKTCSGHSWGMFYTTFSVNEGFHALYNNKYKLLDKFTGYWSQVAKTFTNNQYVLAYELINEPWPGNMYNNPFIMIPHLSEMANLQRVYDHLSHAIR
jgi:endoglycosylceramidase